MNCRHSGKFVIRFLSEFSCHGSACTKSVMNLVFGMTIGQRYCTCQHSDSAALCFIQRIQFKNGRIQLTFIIQIDFLHIAIVATAENTGSMNVVTENGLIHRFSVIARFRAYTLRLFCIGKKTHARISEHQSLNGTIALTEDTDLLRLILIM